MAFLENGGQFTDRDVVLYGGSDGFGVAFKAGSVLMNQEVTDHIERGPVGTGSYRNLLDSTVLGCTVELTFEGCNPVVPRGEGSVPGTHNYLLGSDPEGWITGVHAYSRVVYEDLYDGIDLVYMGTDSGLKYEFHLGPGVDPSVISVRASGQDSLDVVDGDLVMNTGVASVRDGGLEVFYADGDQERLVASFQLLGTDGYGFIIEGRDPGRPLVIDPLVFSTYLGSSMWDSCEAIVADDEGNLYITGDSSGADFPTTTGVYQENLVNLIDVFVMKMAADGSRLIWSTFIGGTDMDSGADLMLDDSGNVYVCGGTYSDNYPTTPDAFQSKTTGNFDAFVSKLNPTGSRLLASTLIGGYWDDPALSIDMDDHGNIYITGETNSGDFPTTPGALDRSKNDTDAFVTRVNASAKDLDWSTFLGGSGQDFGDDLVLDVNGSVYVVGRTRSSDFPVSVDANQTAMAGLSDAFVAKLGPDGSALEAGSYLGGRFFDQAMGVALGSDGDVHVFGSTTSDDFPVTPGAFQTDIGSIRNDNDAFATRMDWNLTTIRACTFVGGDAEDYCPDGALDPQGNVILGGFTMSTNFPTTPGAYQVHISAFDDGFLTKLSADYSELQYSTHIGSVDSDEGVAVAAYGTMNAYLIGETFSDKFPTTAGALQTKANDYRDGFVAMFSLDIEPPVAVAGEDVEIDQHETVTFNGSASGDDHGIANWTWKLTYDGAPLRLYGPTPSWTFHEAGTYQVTLVVRDGANNEATDVVNVTVRDITAPVADAGLSRTVRQGDTVQFDAAGSSDNVGIVNWTWSFVYFGEEQVLLGEVAEYMFDRAGTFNVSLTVWDAVGLNATDHVIIEVLDLTAPVANAGEDITVDQHERVELNGSLSTDTTQVVNWTWNFAHAGAPVEVYGEVAWFTFEHAGVYVVVLRVEDAAGNHDLDTVTVTVRDSTPPVAVPGPDQAVDEGAVVQFDGSASTDNVGIVSYGWTFTYGGEDISKEGVEATHRFDLPGMYAVVLEVTDDEGNVGSATMTVTVHDVTPPVARAPDDMTVDAGTPVALDGTSSSDNVGIVAYEWSFEIYGETVTLEGSTPTYTFDQVGAVTITLTVEDAAGLSASDQMVLTVLDATPPVAVAHVLDQVVQGSTVTLDGSQSHDDMGIVSYVWTFEENGAKVTQEGVSVDYPFNLVGTFAIALTVTDAEGNTDTDVHSLQVLDGMAPVIMVTIPGDATVGELVVLDASISSDNVGIVKWTWTIRDGEKIVTLDGAKVEYAFENPGDHSVTLTLEDAEGNEATQDYTVHVSSLLWLYLLLAIGLGVGIALGLLRGRGPSEPSMKG
ncbi:MAG: PKD domain-containing protein [Thermoplasmata archaeon]|nr:MAG: PKD domain-containing protein [Thermoplasmata archaeon]